MSHNPPNGPAPQGPHGPQGSQYNQQPGQYPPPGYGQQPPQKKGKKKWVIGCLGLIVLAIVFFAGCAALVSGSTDEPVPVPNETSSDTAGEENANSDTGGTDEETATNLAIGETVAMGDLEHTLHSARFDQGNDFSTPDPGTRWLVVDVELTNKSDESEAISSMMMWTLNDSDNRSSELSIMADMQGSMDGELGAGRSMRGEIAYEVSADETNWELIFEPNVFGFGQAIYDIPAESVQ